LAEAFITAKVLTIHRQRRLGITVAETLRRKRRSQHDEAEGQQQRPLRRPPILDRFEWS
jgi:hypothetical protein